MSVISSLLKTFWKSSRSTDRGSSCNPRVSDTPLNDVIIKAKLLMNVPIGNPNLSLKILPAAIDLHLKRKPKVVLTLSEDFVQVVKSDSSKNVLLNATYEDIAQVNITSKKTALSLTCLRPDGTHVCVCLKLVSMERKDKFFKKQKITGMKVKEIIEHWKSANRAQETEQNSMDDGDSLYSENGSVRYFNPYRSNGDSYSYSDIYSDSVSLSSSMYDCDNTQILCRDERSLEESLINSENGDDNFLTYSQERFFDGSSIYSIGELVSDSSSLSSDSDDSDQYSIGEFVPVSFSDNIDCFTSSIVETCNHISAFPLVEENKFKPVRMLPLLNVDERFSAFSGVPVSQLNKQYYSC